MRRLLMISAAALVGTSVAGLAQTPSQIERQPGLAAPQPTFEPNQPNVFRTVPPLERETTGMGLREPEAQFLFSPGAREPQRNDPTVSPFGPMNNIE